LGENRILCARDVAVRINHRPLLQAENAELRISKALHSVRSCFCSEDIAHIRGNTEIKLHLTNVRFQQPFENCNFYDLDNFVTEIGIEGITYVLEGCWWDDFKAVAKSGSFREYISITALRVRKEE